MRNRSMALIVRDEKILMVQALRRGNYYDESPDIDGVTPNLTTEEILMR